MEKEQNKKTYKVEEGFSMKDCLDEKTYKAMLNIANKGKRKSKKKPSKKKV